MKRKFLLLLLSITLIFSVDSYSQIGEGGYPMSFSSKSLSAEIDNVILQSPDMLQIMAADEMDEKNGELHKIGTIIPTSLNMQNSGTWDFLSDGTKIWRLKISCQGALSLVVLYDNFYLPQGSSLFLYNENKRQIIGALGFDNNPKFGNSYSTQMIEGGNTYLEYIQPSSVIGNPIISIEGVVYNYREVESFVARYSDKKETGFGQSGDCNVNVNCTEGANWQDQKKGVAEIFVIAGGGAGWCSGSLMNNTSNDGTPYFLTADHCGGVDGNGSFNQWQFYFNFEATACANPNTEPSYNTITGCTLRARPSGQQASGTDFLLLELNTTEDDLETIGAYYNGWDRTGDPAANGVCIHHPSGDIKKISTYTQALTQTTYSNQNTTNGHWEAYWAQTATSQGITEGGSSGSPLFNGENKLVVGTLTGGASGCNQPASNLFDDYGRFDLHWENGGTVAANRCKPWLDPENTNATTCEGRYPNSNTPDPTTITADFTANPTNVTIGGSVVFTDRSTGNPTSWTWSFEGGNPATSTTQNPTITYPTAGVYSVTLTVSNADGNDQEIKTSYITVSANLDPDTDPDPDAPLSAAFSASEYTITIGDCINFTDLSSGTPTSWTWTFQGAETVTSTMQHPQNICYNVPGVYNVTLYVQNADGFDSHVCDACITVENNTDLPIAQFEANVTTIPVGGVVRFTNLSMNGPFNQWAWTFEGGIPFTSSDSVPPVVAYTEVGTYGVELRCRKSNGVQDIEYKENYIRVVPEGDEVPTANFTADYTFVNPGESVHFIDLSLGNPYNWSWEFEGGNPATSIQTNPSVIYSTAGTYNVKLTVSNNLGANELVKELYIVVSETDPCTQAPVVDFTATQRIIPAGSTVSFENLSTNIPTYSMWTFQGGNPSTSTEGSPVNPITYNIPGIYDVTLFVSNACGSSSITKEDYIYVFNGPVSSYCDTLTNIVSGDIVEPKTPSGSWGYVAGQNGKKIKAYADYFYDYTFSQVRSLLVPVNHSVYGAYDSYVKFYVWNAENGMPAEELGSKKVFIRNLTANQTNLVKFDAPIPVSGPFFVGFSVNYPDENNDEISDDLFVVPIVSNRGNSGMNTLYVQKSGVWSAAPDVIFYNSSLPIQPVSCLVDVEDFDADDKSVDVFPNPTDGLLNIALNAITEEDVTIEIYNLVGNLISTQTISNTNEFSIDISDYSDGIYVLKVSSKTFVSNKKITLTK